MTKGKRELVRGVRSRGGDREMAKSYSWERREGESAIAYGAFVLYCEMGASRSYVGLAGRLKKPVRRIRLWGSQYSWRKRALAFDSFCDGVTLKLRLREAARIGRLQARKAGRHTRRIVRELMSIDPRKMSVLEAIALLELSIRIERDALEIGTGREDETPLTPEKSPEWLQ
jgi:hypothetical protein